MQLLCATPPKKKECNSALFERHSAKDRVSWKGGVIGRVRWDCCEMHVALKRGGERLGHVDYNSNMASLNLQSCRQCLGRWSSILGARGGHNGAGCFPNTLFSSFLQNLQNPGKMCPFLAWFFFPELVPLSLRSRWLARKEVPGLPPKIGKQIGPEKGPGMKIGRKMCQSRIFS